MQFLVIVGLILTILFGTSGCDGEDSKEDNPSTARLLSEAKPLYAVNAGICANPAAQVARMMDKWDEETGYKYVVRLIQKKLESDKDGELNTNLRIFAGGLSSPELLEGDILSTVRNQAFNRTFLMAKADIIRALYGEISANSYVKKRPSGLMMGTNIDDMRQSLLKGLKGQKQLEGDLEKLNEEIDALSEAVVDAGGDELAGITFRYRADSLLEAATKKLDATYIDDMRQSLLKGLKGQKQLEGDLEKLNEEMDVFFSFMPLLGAKVIKQFHCYDAKTRRYALAIRVVWSTKLQEEAELAMTGKTTKLNNKRKI